MAKNENSNPADSAADAARLVTTAEDKAKAAKWFQRARELGDKRQFDYAIEYYVNGLEFWPNAIEEACKPLHGCAVARRQTGGKKAGLKDSMKRSVKDKDAKKAFLNSLWLFGKDPENLSYLEAIGRNASRLRAEDAAYWAFGVLFKALESAPKATQKQFQALVSSLEEMGDRAALRDDAEFAVDLFRMGIEALTIRRNRYPSDDAVDKELKNLSTKMTILKGKYQKGESYRDSIVDAEEQTEQHDKGRSIQADERVNELIDKARKAHEADPENAIALKELVDMLCRRERDDEETEAIGVLVAEFKRANDYRWKLLADDIRMKQLGRAVRNAKQQGDRDEIKKCRIDQLRFELGVYKDRSQRYPTDGRYRFEYGVRNFEAGRFDDAIPLLQSARSDPKNRAVCGMYLGRCFFRKGYHDQAIQALEAAIADHPIPDDDRAKMMQYWLGRTQEAAGKPGEARKTFGKILQLDYNYGDVRARLDALPQ